MQLPKNNLLNVNQYNILITFKSKVSSEETVCIIFITVISTEKVLQAEKVLAPR